MRLEACIMLCSYMKSLISIRLMEKVTAPLKIFQKDTLNPVSLNISLIIIVVNNLLYLTKDINCATHSCFEKTNAHFVPIRSYYTKIVNLDNKFFSFSGFLHQLA